MIFKGKLLNDEFGKLSEKLMALPFLAGPYPVNYGISKLISTPRPKGFSLQIGSLGIGGEATTANPKEPSDILHWSSLN
jgi:hypothetical protein